MDCLEEVGGVEEQPRVFAASSALLSVCHLPAQEVADGNPAWPDLPFLVRVCLDHPQLRNIQVQIV